MRSARATATSATAADRAAPSRRRASGRAARPARRRRTSPRAADGIGPRRRRAAAWTGRLRGRPHGARYRFTGYRRRRERRTRLVRRRRRWLAPTGGTLVVPDGQRPARAGQRVAGSPTRPVRTGSGSRCGSQPGEHVVGFGERFDALDQRGARLDAVVFEQYKAPGRTGAPTCRCRSRIVVGGDGWGFHVDTAARDLVRRRRADGPAVDRGGGRPARARLDAAALRRRSRPTCCARSSTRPAGRPRCRTGCSGCGPAATSGTPRSGSLRRGGRRTAEHDIPVGAVVIEAWSDESTFVAFRDAEYERARRRRARTAWPTSRSRRTAPGPTRRRMVDELHARDVKVLLWQIPLHQDAPAPRPARPAADAAHDGRAAATRCARPTARPYRNRGWWFPLALMPDLTDPSARATGGRPSGATSSRTSASTASRPTAASTRGATTCATPTARAATRGNNLFPVHYAEAYGDLLRERGKAPVTFSRAGFTGSPAHGVFWAGDEDSTWEAFRGRSITAGLTAGVVRDRLLGLGSRRVLRRRSPTPSSTCGRRRRRRFCRSCSTTRSSTTTAPRRATAPRGTSPSGPATTGCCRCSAGSPSCASGSCPTSRRAGCRDGRDRPAADAPALLRPPGRPAGLGAPAAVDARRRPAGRPGGRGGRDDPVGLDLPPGRWLDLRTHQVLDGATEVEVPAPVDEIPVWCRLETGTPSRPVHLRCYPAAPRRLISVRARPQQCVLEVELALDAVQHVGADRAILVQPQGGVRCTAPPSTPGVRRSRGPGGRR